MLTGLLTALCGAAHAGQPAPVILDTDMHSDCDDVGALAVLNALADRGEARLLGVVHTAPAPAGPKCAQAINAYYGRSDVPVGWVDWPDYETSPVYALYRRAAAHVDQDDRHYVERVAEAFPVDEPVRDGVDLYRTLLANAEDDSVVICAVGQLQGLARLLDSGPDEHSPLTGRELVAEKVRLLTTMALGVLPEGRDGFNWECDRVSAARVLNDWPAPLAVSHRGQDVLTGARLLTETPEDNPVRMAYDIYLSFKTAGRAAEAKNRSSWDQLAVLYAVRGADGLFEVTGGRRLSYDGETGLHRWEPDPDSDQVCVDLAVSVEEAAKAVEDLMVAPPRNAS
jgi:hypothetical protein